MVAKGWLTQAERDAADVPDHAKRADATTSGTNGYIVKTVKDVIRPKRQPTDADIDRDGLKIVTHLRRQEAGRRGQGDGAVPTSPKNLHGGPGRDPAGQRRDPRDVRRPGRREAPVQRRDRRHHPGRLDVQALRAHRRARERREHRQTLPGFSPEFFPQFKDTSATTDFLPAGRCPELRQRAVRAATTSSTHGSPGQHRLRPGQHRRRPQEHDGGRRYRGCDDKMKSVYANVFGTDNVKVIDMANAYATLAANGRQVRRRTSSSRSPHRWATTSTPPSRRPSACSTRTWSPTCCRPCRPSSSGAPARMPGRGSTVRPPARPVRRPTTTVPGSTGSPRTWRPRSASTRATARRRTRTT